MKQPVVLRIYLGDKLEAVRQFEQSQIVIGRNADSQLELKDDGVALLHAIIEERDGEHFVSDLGSSTGTFKNGNRVLEEKIASGDELKIGPYKIQFFIGVPKPIVAPVSTSTSATDTSSSAGLSAAAAGLSSDSVKPPPKPTAPPNFVMMTPSLPVSAPGELPVAPPVSSKGPSAVTHGTSGKDKAKDGKKRSGTFAPMSTYGDLREIIKPAKGTVIEVIVAWQDRVLSSNHFKDKGSVFISSSDDADVMVPIVSSKSKYELLKISTQCTVCLTQEMTGELVRDGETLAFADLARQGKMRNVGTHFEIDIRQGEMVRINLRDNIALFVRYVGETPKPLVAPLLDMTSSEVTGVILALAIAAILGLYMNIYTPSPLLEDEARIEEPIRKAVVKFNPPPKIEAVEEPKVEPVKQEKKVVEAKDKVSMAPQQKRQTPTPSPEKAGDPGKAGDVKPKPKSENKPKELTSTRQGGAIKTAKKEGANMKSEKPDPTKVGLLSAFASKGAQKKLDEAYSGSGELSGMADQATGTAGSAENREGDQMGAKMKDTGAGGKGSQTVGISGVGTQGRGTGTTGYGTGGIGTKGSVQINVGGQEGEFPGGMDKEAIRRVIREHIKEIRSCYERELQRSPDLYGKLVLEWDIEEGGRVSRCVVKSNALGNETVANCISARLKTWKFPDPPKDQIGRVSFPFVFSSQ